MDNIVIWDGAVEKYRTFLIEEIVSASPAVVEPLPIVLADAMRKALDQAQVHQEKHKVATGLNEKSLDIYKALSWMTCTMSRACQGTPVFHSAVRAGLEALNDCLKREEWNNEGLPVRSINLMEAMFINELDGIPEHGIERNGLFMAFHSALEVLKNQN